MPLATNLYQTSFANEEVNPPQVVAGYCWFAFKVLPAVFIQLAPGVIEKAPAQLSFAGMGPFVQLNTVPLEGKIEELNNNLSAFVVAATVAAQLVVVFLALKSAEVFPLNPDCTSNDAAVVLQFPYLT